MNVSLKLSNLQSLLIINILELSFFMLMLSFHCLDPFVELLDLIVKFVSFCVPLMSLSFISLQPSIMLSLSMTQLFLELLDVPFMESKHLLNFQIQSLNLLVLVSYLGL